MAEGLRLVVSSDGIATVRMCNGENRFRLSFVQACQNMLDEVERNGAVTGLVVTGGDKYFSLGLDVDYFRTQSIEYVEATRNEMAKFYKRLVVFPVPTVAAINGHAYGAGAFLALACDYRVMRSDQGWLCWPEVALKMQIRPTSLGMIRVKMPVGIARRDAVLFGKRLTATEAHVLQLVDVVTHIDSLERESEMLIQEVLGKHGIDRTTLTAMKQDIYGNEIIFKDANSKL